ncbi:nicotinate phosphoribosyltransferase [Mycoplasmoides pirum]|uniref:nicotinate phosphoribosyltransferase n=1 Tax=Mycoplasmoides pirum TaxID=2122 RepID=UPI000488C6C4|nr:nicotinate phosphoribosyltransferase [Mycoplasmoides pirum]
MNKNKIITPWDLDESLVSLIPCDAYKLVHRLMYPKNVQNLYLTFTARGNKNHEFKDISWNHLFVKKVVNNILNNFTKHVIKLSQENSNGRITKLLKNKLNNVFQSKKFSENFINVLKELGKSICETKKLPIVVKAYKSSDNIPFQKSLMIITGKKNINPNFVWLITYFETIILENIWQFSTSLTIARDYFKLVEHYAELSADNLNFIKYQCHDFSMRGMSSLWSAIYSGNAHLMYFEGSDTIISGNNAKSVFASEHSVMSIDGQINEFNTYKRLINQFPNDILSLVSDTWNIWNVLDNILPKLKKDILKRKKKLVIRPDSGDPIEIICGKKNFNWKNKNTWGVIHYLDYHFGHKINKKGFKELHPKIGIIYGDAITYKRTKAILENLTNQKYSSKNIVFGVGATTYQSTNRDTLGFVSKITSVCQINQNNKKVWNNVEKNPITDYKKKSLTGRFTKDKNLIKIY